MKTNLLNSSESEVRNNSILYVTEGAASSVVSAVSVPYVSRKSLVSRLMRTAAVVMLLMAVGIGQMWGAKQRYIYVGISNNYQTYKDNNKYGFNFWGGTSGGVKSGTYLTSYEWDGRTYYMYRVQVYDDNNKAQFKGNDSWYDPGDGFSVTLNGTTNNAVFFSHSNDGWGGQFQENYQETSNASLAATSTSEAIGTGVTLTPSLSSNTTYNEIKSTSYSVTTNPNSAGSVTSAGEFSATKAGSYIVTATVTYNAKDFSGITKTATATKTITVYATVTFDKEGGTDGTSTQNATYGSATSNITAPTKSNYDFGGYYDGDNGTGTQIIDASGVWQKNKTDFTDNSSTAKWIILNNTTLYAKWTPKTYSITYKDQGNVAYSGSNSSSLPSSYTYGTGIATLTDGVKSGYRFDGWFENSSCTGSAITSISSTATGNKTLYAKWTENPGGTITLSAGTGGQVSTDNSSFGATKSITGVKNTTARNIYARANSGYSFNKWTITTGDGTITSTTTANTTYTPVANADATLTASFTETMRTITISGGTASSTTAGVATQGTATAADPAAGKKFTGWTLGSGVTLATGYVLTDKIIKFTATANSTVTANYADRAKVKLYFAKPSGWAKVNAYAWNNSDDSQKNADWPGVAVTTTETINYVTYYVYQYYTEADGIGNDATGNSVWNRVIFNDGSTQTGNLTITDEHYYFKSSSDAGKSAAITSAWCIKGSFNDWSEDADQITHSSATSGSKSISITTGNKTFKIYNIVNDTWWRITSDDVTATLSATAMNNNSGDMTLKPTAAGNYTFTLASLTGTPTLAITFPTTYTLTYSIGSVAGNNGSISTSPSTASGSKVLSGTNITLTAPEAMTGYTWKGWYTNAAGTTGKINDTNRAITVTMSADKTLYACYTENTFNVKATASPAAGGTVTPTSNTAMGQVTGGNITATPGAGYSFSGWTIASGSGYFGTTGTNTTSATADTKFRPTAASTLTGSFSEVMRTVSVGVNNAAFGTVSTSSLTNVGPATASAEVTATPAAGATFTGWTLQSGVTAATGYTTSSNPIKVNATDASKTITANFTETKYSVTLTNANSSQGTVNTSSPVSVGQITAVQIQATKKAGYKFKKWEKTAGTGTVTYHTASGTGKATDSSGANKATTYITVTGNVTLQATWEEDPSTGWFLLGEFNSWNTSANEFLKDAGTTTGNISYVRLNLSPDDYSGGTTPFTLKIYNNNDWYGNCNSTSEYTCPQYTINESGEEWGFYKDTDSDPHSNFEVMITVAGVYEFVWNSSTEKLAINYPEYNISLAMSDQVQQGTNLSVDVTARSIKTGSTPGASARYVYEYAAASTAANPLSTYGAWQEFQSSTAGNTLSKAAPANIGWYKMRVKMMYEGNTYMSDEKKFAVYNNYIITIKENETTQGWFKMIYAWNNYDNTYQNENYPGEMKDTITSIVDAKTWLYEFKYPYYTKMVINGKDMETNKSDDLEITGHTCLTITGNKEGVANWAVTKEDNCSNTFYRVKTTIGSKTYYSNMVENATDWVSFYANLTDAAKIYIQTSNGTTITDMDVTSTYKSQMRNLTNGDPQNHSYDGTTYPGNVFKAKIASNSTLSNLELYKGNYYISCESSAGGTYNYINEGNKFNRFVPDRTSVNEWYNHYYCQWIIAEKPVVATVGNEYNRSLSVTLGADRFCPGGVVPNITNEYHDVNGVRTAYEGNGLNIRFAYDNYSNRFERAALMGSTATLENDVHYLQAYGDYLYKGKTGNEVYSSENGMAVFTDISNYTYQVELYADKTSTIVLEAPIHFHHDGSNLIQYLLGVDAEDTPLRPALLDGESNDRWHMRIIYDYKINRIITAWLVDDTENISENKVLDANMMVTRYADTKSSVISVNTGKSVSAVHKVITVLEFTLEDVRSVGIESGDYVEASFWICLPYDCMVSDVFGIGNYNPDYAALDGNIRKWQICRYAGEKRAQNGWYKPTTTFWYKQDQDGVDYMHAYQGYAVNLKLHKTNDFKVVQVQKKDANGDPMFDGDKPILEDKTLVRIYFPSKDTGEDFTVENETDMQVTLDPYICDKQTATEDRRLKDSNWHLIGNPTYAQARVTTSSVRSNYDWNTYSMSTTVANYTFLYRYDFKKRGDSSRSYVAFDATSQDMYPTFAYMAQWAGVMHWTANSASLKSSNIRRRMAADDEQLRRQVRLELRQTKEDNEEFADQTYINLTDDATEGFDLNLDLEKLNNGNGDLYSLSSVQDDPIQQLAANSMPVQDRTVMLGVNIAENGTYTISMPDETEGLVATLYDSETKQEYNLASESCRVELAKGKYENRFMLILKVTDGSQTTTSTSDAQHQITIAQRDGEFVINGIDEPTQATLYDAVGKQIYQGKIISGSIISTPQSGVYLLHIGSEVYRIMRK